MKKILLFPFALLLALFTMAQAPVAYYPFTGNANDAVGANNGTVNGATLTTDRFGNANSAYSFDGVDDFVSTTNLATNQTDNWTMTAWVKPASISQADGTIVINGFDNGGSGSGYVMLMNNGTGGGAGNVLSGLFSQVTYINSGATFTNNNIWYHVAMVRQSGTTRFYLNSVQAPNTSIINPLTPSGSLRIGSCTGNRFWNGAIDEVKIFNTALTAAQVQQQYNPNNYSSQFNNSVKMNGVNDAITIPNNAAINFGTGNFGIELWMKSPANNKRELILDKRDDGCNGTGAMWGIEKLVDNSVNFFINVSGGGLTYVTNIPNAADNNWHHLSFVRDGINMLAYKDGILAGTISTSVLRNVSNSANLGIGTGPCGPFIAGGGFPTGNFDEVRLWNTARTQAQIVAAMNSQLTGSEAGLVGYWDMNRNGQGAGLTVDNKCIATGAALNGTTAGTASTPIFAPGVTQQKPGSGNAISFDGVDDVIDIPSNTANNFTLNQNFTIECWAKIPSSVQPNEATESANSLIEKWDGVTGGYPYVIRYRNNNPANVASVRNKIEVARWNGTNYVPFHSSISVNDDKFHHISATKNGSLLSLYIDGVLQSTATDLSSGQTDNPDPLHIGGRTMSMPLPFNGLIDEVRIWNTALTQSQIRDRMCSKITSADALYPNLVAYYNFDESTGTTAFDGTVNNNNGTLTNSPTRVTSGAAIGTASSHDYVNATKTTSLAHASGESFTVTSTSGSPAGIQVYRVDEQPNTLSGATGVGTNNKYFGVFQAGGTAPQYTAVYNYNGNPGVNIGNEFQLRLNKRTDNAATTWSMLPDVPNEAANTITVTGESTEYILGKLGSPLPLNLISFSASKQNNDALLQWKTANEINVSRFEVQRSTNGQTFETIGTVAAGGSLYSLTDANTFSSRAVSFYRLKSIDVDDRFTYSNIIKLSKQTSAALTVYPNPVSDVLTISGLKQNGTVLLYNAEGKLLQQQTVTAQTITMDMSKYAKGIYLLQYKTGDEVVNQKIIKQ